MGPEGLRLSNAVWWGGYDRKLANFFRLTKRIPIIISLLYCLFNSRFGQDNDIKKEESLAYLFHIWSNSTFGLCGFVYDSMLLVPNSGLYCMLSPSIAVV